MTALPPDPYKILNIGKLADKSEIRKAYHRLVLKCHPDKVLDLSLKTQKQNEFQQVQKAYELLINDAERSRYDDQVRLAELRRQVNAQKNSSPNTSAARAPTAKFEVFLSTKVESKTKSSPSAHKAASAAAASPKIYTINASARSCDDEIHHSHESRHHDRPHRSASYEKPSKRDEERREERRRRKEEEERAEQHAKDTIRRDKKRLEKTREKERARQSTEEKNSWQKIPYVEPLPYAHESEAYFSKSDKKPSKSRKRADSSAARNNEAAAGTAAAPAIVESDRSAKTESMVSVALEHMKKCGGQLPCGPAPSLTRAKTYHGSGEAAAFSLPPQTAPTPPPPPPPERRESDATARLQADKTPSSHHKRHKDTPHSVPTLHKSTPSPPGGGLPLRPGLSSSPDAGYSRHMPATLGRSHTYHAGYADMADHSDMRRPSLDDYDYYVMQEGTGRERHRYRSSRRPRSPPPQQKYRIGKDLKATEVWSPSHGDSGPSSYFPKPLRHEDIIFGTPHFVHAVDSDADEDNIPFSHVKTSGHYQPHHVAPIHLSDVQYSKHDPNYDSADAHRPQPYTSVRA